MPTYGSLARPAFSMCQGTGARLVQHPAFTFGAIETHAPLARELATSMGLKLIPTAADWPALAAEAATDFRLGDAETRQAAARNPRWQRDLDDALDDALRTLNIHATRAELLAAIEALDTITT